MAPGHRAGAGRRRRPDLLRLPVARRRAAGGRRRNRSVNTGRPRRSRVLSARHRRRRRPTRLARAVGRVGEHLDLCGLVGEQPRCGLGVTDVAGSQPRELLTGDTPHRQRVLAMCSGGCWRDRQRGHERIMTICSIASPMNAGVRVGSVRRLFNALNYLGPTWAESVGGADEPCRDDATAARSSASSESAASSQHLGLSTAASPTTRLSLAHSQLVSSCRVAVVSNGPGATAPSSAGRGGMPARRSRRRSAG
jgi:hypothetical protein